MSPDKSVDEMYKDIASELGMSYSQLLGDEEIPKAGLAWKFAHGKPQIRPK